MNKLLYFVIAIAAYVVGTICPCSRLLPSIDPQGPVVSAYNYYSLVVNIILAFFTFLTVCVALLKEDLVSLWRKPKLHVDQNSLSFSEELTDGSSSATKQAHKYTISFRLENKKDIIARNIKVVLNQINFKNHQANITNNLSIKNKTLNIQGEGFLSRFNPIIIELITLEKLQQPQSNQVQPSQQASQQPTHTAQQSIQQVARVAQRSPKQQVQVPSTIKTPQQDVFRLKIGDNEISDDYHNGELEILFTILCSESSSVCKKISLKWDKKWEDRLHDMQQQNHLSANFLENK